MAWIKRNKFFVISMAVGLLLIGGCAYLFWNNLGGVASKKTEYQDDVGQLQNLRNANPYPSDANIASANEDQAHVRDLLADFQKALVSFPAAPKLDDQGFKAYLGQSIYDLGMAASNAQVGLPDAYAFTFTDQQKKFNFPAENIRPWMDQLAEIKALCAVLYKARVNSLVTLQRVRVSATDEGPQADFFDAQPVTNAPLVATPYKLVFRGFSRELAYVLSGLAESSNCFIVKLVQVQHEPEDLMASVSPTQPPPVVVPVSPPPGFTPAAPGEDPRSRFRLGMATPPPEQAPRIAAPRINPRGVPVTVLSESLLKISIAVDVVKFSGGSH